MSAPRLVWLQPRVHEGPVFEAQVVRMLDTLNREGRYRITVLQRNPASYRAEHVELVRLDRRGPGFYLDVRRRLRELRPDAVLFRNPNVLRYWPLLRRHRRIYVVKGLFHRELAMQRDPWSRVKAPLFRRAERFLAARAHAVLAQSLGMRDALLRLAPRLSPERIRVMPSCTPRVAEENRRLRGPVRICFLGAGEWWHQLPAVDELFRTIEGWGGFECFLFVHDVREERFRSRAHVEALRPADVAQRLLDMDVGVILDRPPHFYRFASPIKVAEYLACGLGVVTSETVGDFPALIGDRDFCHVLRDAEGLRAWLARFRDSRFRARVKREARDFADGYLVWEAHEETFAEAVRAAIG